jgi:DNA polymerase
VIVGLGATAARALLGSKYRLTKAHGKFVEQPWGPHVTATIHPSSVLRAPNAERRHREYRNFVDDLLRVRNALTVKK